MNKDELQNSYAADMKRIQDIVDMLGRNECDIDKLLEYVNEATALIEKCQMKLEKTGLQINDALARLNNSSTAQN